jgi:hypothetical protein
LIAAATTPTTTNKSSGGTIRAGGANPAASAKTTTGTGPAGHRFATASSTFETIFGASPARELAVRGTWRADTRVSERTATGNAAVVQVAVEPMKSHASWYELSVIAGGLMIVMFVAMWAQRPDESCTLSLEGTRVLVLSRETDREHLATDLASAARLARRYMRSTVDPAEQQTRFADCEARLIQQIATRHGLSPDNVRTSATDAR